MDKFVYLGFLPTKKGRQTLIKGLLGEERTIILYESPHRIHKTLSQLSEFGFDDHQLVIARELTKLHETVYRGTVAELNEQLKDETLKGEMVLVLHK